MPVVFISFTLFCVGVEASTQLSNLEKRQWIKVSTANFHIITDLKEKKAIRIASNLEKFRRMYQLVFATELPDQENPIKIIAPKKSLTFDLLTGGKKQLRKTNGFFIANNYGNYATIEGNRFNGSSKADSTRLVNGNKAYATRFPAAQRIAGQSSLNRLFHEYTHHLAANQYSYNLPFWYSEGFADFLSTAKIQDSGLVIFGQPIEYHLKAIDGRSWMKMESLFKTTRIGATNQQNSYRVYSQGWLMVHYFLANEKRSAQLKKFISLLASGQSVDDAMLSALERTYEQLDIELLRYAKRGKLYYKTIDTSTPLATTQILAQALSPSEVLFEFGEFFLNGLSQPDQAEKYFKRSVEIQSDNPNSLAGLAQIHMRTDKPSSQKYIEQALEQDQNTAWIHVVAGDINGLLNAESNSDTKAKTARARAMHHYSRAIDLQANNVAAISSKASIYLKEADFERALKLFQTAYRYAPSSNQARFDLIVSNYAVGRFEQGDTIAEIVRRNHHATNDEIVSFNAWAAEQRANAVAHFERGSK